jgi:type IV secretory pathway VirJ component
MATGLITVLSNVPWSDVIRHAPQVAEGARKLWDRARGKPPVAEVSAAPAAVTPEQQALAALEARTVALQAAVLDLQSQMTESAKLIQELAALNEQMIQHVQAQDRRLRGLGIVSAVLGLVAVLGWLLVFLRPAG